MDFKLSNVNHPRIIFPDLSLLNSAGSIYFESDGIFRMRIDYFESDGIILTFSLGFKLTLRSLQFLMNFAALLRK